MPRPRRVAGYGGIAAVPAATGVAAGTIGRGLKELTVPDTLDPGRIRRRGSGRKLLAAKDVTLLGDLLALVEPTGSAAPQPSERGNPTSPLRPKWSLQSGWRLPESCHSVRSAPPDAPFHAAAPGFPNGSRIIKVYVQSKRGGPIQQIEATLMPWFCMLTESHRPQTTLRRQEELMNSDVSESTARRGGHPILRILASFPIACFTCALLTDLTYVQTTNVMWTNFSSWLLAAGMAGGVVAAIAGVVSWLTHRRDRAQRPAWTFMLGSLLVLVIAFLNNLVHSRDAWTSVMPTGLALSFVTILLMLATAWLGSSAGRRRGVAMPYSGIRQ